MVAVLVYAFGFIRVNPRRSLAKEVQKNAAQASHLGRIARECDANRFHLFKGRIVKSETALPKERKITETPCGQSIREYKIHGTLA